jgi:hypothetical protein
VGLFPHERSLVQRYEQRPFALLGVNLDRARQVLRRTEEKEHLNWRSWWDGADAAIAETWQIQGLPSMFLIDHRGVIRYEFHGMPKAKDLEKRIEELLREAEKATVALAKGQSGASTPGR